MTPPTSAAACEACAEPILEDSVAPTIGMLAHVEALHRELAEARAEIERVRALAETFEVDARGDFVALTGVFSKSELAQRINAIRGTLMDSARRLREALGEK